MLGGPEGGYAARRQRLNEKDEESGGLGYGLNCGLDYPCVLQGGSTCRQEGVCRMEHGACRVAVAGCKGWGQVDS